MFLFDTQLFWYRLVFLTELIVAEALFTYKFDKRSRFALRVASSVFVAYAFTFCYPLLSFGAIYSSVMFLAIFAVTVGGMAFCFRGPFVNVVFCALAAYTVQHFAYVLHTCIVTVTGLEADPMAVYGSGGFTADPNFPFSVIIYADSYAVVYWLAYLVFGTRIKKKGDLRLGNIPLLVIAALIVVVDVLLNSIVTARFTSDTDVVVMAIVYLYNMLGCAFVLFIQFMLLSKQHTERDLDVERQLRRMEQAQYETARDNMEVIELKCHDLKHQIHRMRAGLSGDELNEIEDAIAIYETGYRTGNEALDVILTEKSRLCRREGIRMVCVADGSALGFMSEADIYSLFGNAVDNAIEAVGKLKDEEMRTIDLSVKVSRAFLSVSISNYYADDVVFSDGLPMTTKQDKAYHGFGVKSMRRITEKYDGDLSMNAEDGVFTLNILFPLKTEKNDGSR